jgi:hypothetical protein
MELPIQIDVISVARAANAAHFEYMSTVCQRVEAAQLENDLWQTAERDFITAYKAEDKAFKQYRASELTEPIRQADEERDRIYASLRDAIKAFAKFPVESTAENAAPLLRVIKNYKITTRENYMKESGLIDNMLQDLMQYRAQLTALGLRDVVSQLRQKNDEVRQLIADRNDERMEQIAGVLKAARRASDEAYAVLVLYTNAFAALNPTVTDAQNLVRQMQEDLEYFRQHALTTQSRTGSDTPETGGGAPENV